MIGTNMREPKTTYRFNNTLRTPVPIEHFSKNQESTVGRKAILFARVSTARQEKEGLSLDEIQLPRMREYARQKGLRIVKEFKVGETGGQYKERKKFMEMVDYFRDHDDIVDLIAFRADRISRNFRDAVLIDELMQHDGKHIHCVDENMELHKDSRASALTSWNVKMFVAQEYLNRIKEDGVNTKYTKLERGELPWSAPFGYEHTVVQIKPKIKTVAPVEPKATIVKECFKLYASGSYSIKSLTDYINRRYGLHVAKSNVQCWLRNRFYIGYIYDSAYDEYYPHNYEQLIDIDLFNAVQDMLDGNRVVRKRHVGKVDAIYRGLLLCKDCGCVYTPDFKTKRYKSGKVSHFKYYHCTNATHQHDKITCIHEEDVDEAIRALLKSLQLPPEKLEALRKELAELHDSKIDFYNAERRELVKRRKQLIARQKNAYDALMDKSITLDLYNENNKRYKDELAEIERKESKLNGADINYYDNVGTLLDIFERADHIFNTALPEDKKRLVGFLLSNLRVSGNSLELTPREPFAKLLLDAKRPLWLGMRDSNPRMPGPEPGALPLGESPVPYNYTTSLFTSQRFNRILL